VDIFVRADLPPKLVTARLVLREVGTTDISEQLLCWLNDPDTTQFLEIRHIPQTQERVERYVRERLIQPESPHFGVYDNGGHRLVGTVTVNQYDPYHKTADISFVIGYPDVGRQGYGTEAVHAVCMYCFQVAGLYKLTGGLYRENYGSRRVFEKNGFSLEGTKRQQYLNREGQRTDALLYGLVCSEFVPDFALLGGDVMVVHPARE